MLYKKDSKGLMQAYINKKEYLAEMKHRLANDVEPVLKLYLKINSEEERSVGFWGMLRLVLPVIESLGRVKYPEVRDSWEYSSNILEELGVPYPKISWKLFRDCLIHGDEMLNVFEDNKELYSGWQISLGDRHNKVRLNPHIDAEKLFYDLYRLLEIETENCDPKAEVILGAIRFSEKQIMCDPKLKKELEDLFG